MKIKNNFLEKAARIDRVYNANIEQAKQTACELENRAADAVNGVTGKSELAVCKKFANLYKKAAKNIRKSISTDTDNE